MERDQSEVHIPNPFSESVVPAELWERFCSASHKLRGCEGLIRVVTHYDPDGIIAGSIMARTFERTSIRFHLSFFKGLSKSDIKTLSGDINKGFIFLDMGCGQVDKILGILDGKGPLIILDHHVPLGEREGIIQINPLLIDKSATKSACGASLSFLLALAFDDGNWDMVDQALTGVIGDKQHLGGLAGINLGIAERALEKGSVAKGGGLLWDEGRSLGDSLVLSVNPFFSALSGDTKRVANFLEEMEISPDMGSDMLSENQKRAVSSRLLLHLLSKGIRAEIIQDSFGPRFYSPNFEMDLEQLAELLNACGRKDKMSIGLALCQRDETALMEASGILRDYVQEVLDGLIKLEREPPSKMKAIQFFFNPNPSMSGTIAGLGMQFIVDKEMPILALSRVNETSKVSGRGTHHLIRKGLDLAAGLSEAAKEVGGNGGGHPIAAGATIPAGKEDGFLKKLDELVVAQMGIGDESGDGVG